MLKRILAICGLVLLLGGTGGGLYLFVGFLQASFSSSGPPSCPYACEPAPSFQLSVSDLVISEDQNDVLTADSLIGNWGFVENGPSLSVTVTLITPDFTYAPEMSVRTVSLSDRSDFNLSWILSPTKPGTFKVGVEVSDSKADNIGYVGITVTNAFGLRVWQTQLVSLIGGLLGPMLTIPWWIDLWNKRKRRKASERTRIVREYHLASQQLLSQPQASTTPPSETPASQSVEAPPPSPPTTSAVTKSRRRKQLS